MSDFRTRKAERILLNQYKARFHKVKCVACNGSGIYDHNGSPKCGCCEGTGKMETLKPGMKL